LAAAISSAHVVDRHARVHREDVGHVAHVDDGLEIRDRVVRKRLEQVGRDGVRVHVAHEDGVAVGRGLRDHVGGDGAARAGAVLDHERLPEVFLQLLRDEARDHVGSAARRESHQHLRGLVRICLRGRERGNQGGKQRRGELHRLQHR
jgi:hypothetical protein